MLPGSRRRQRFDPSINFGLQPANRIWTQAARGAKMAVCDAPIDGRGTKASPLLHVPKPQQALIGVAGHCCHLSGQRISRRRITFNRGSKSPTDALGHFSAADYVASLPRLPRCTNGDNHLRSLLLLHSHHYARPGQEKRSLRLSAEALSRSSEQIGRMVELQNDHRAYEEPLTHNLKVIGSNPILATRHQALEKNRFRGLFAARILA
jgi:hypothetical protein